MHTVEIHVKTSVLNDSITQWVNSGRDDNRDIGSFIFENVKSFNIKSGCAFIHSGQDVYIYNIADLYRVKVAKQKQ